MHGGLARFAPPSTSLSEATVANMLRVCRCMDSGWARSLRSLAGLAFGSNARQYAPRFCVQRCKVGSLAPLPRSPQGASVASVLLVCGRGGAGCTFVPLTRSRTCQCIRFREQQSPVCFSFLCAELPGKLARFAGSPTSLSAAAIASSIFAFGAVMQGELARSARSRTPL